MLFRSQRTCPRRGPSRPSLGRRNPNCAQLQQPERILEGQVGVRTSDIGQCSSATATTPRQIVSACSFLASHHRLATINSQRGNRMRFSCFSTLHSFWSSHRATPPPTPVPDYAGALPSKDRQVSQYIHFGSHFYNRRLHRAPRSQTSHQSCSDPRTRRRAGQAVTSRTSPRDVPRLPSVAVPFAGGPLARSPH